MTNVDILTEKYFFFKKVIIHDVTEKGRWSVYFNDTVRTQDGEEFTVGSETSHERLELLLGHRRRRMLRERVCFKKKGFWV